MKPLITRDRARAEALQALENKANGVPKVASREVNDVAGVWVNIPGTTGAERIRHVLEDGDGNYSYDVESDYSESDKLTGAEKALWAQARAEAVNELPPGPPEWAPAKGLNQ